MAKNKITVEIDGDAKGLTKATSDAENSIKEMTGNIKKGALGSAAAFAGLVAGIGLVTKQFINFNDGFTTVQTLLDKGSFKNR